MPYDAHTMYDSFRNTTVVAAALGGLIAAAWAFNSPYAAYGLSAFALLVATAFLTSKAWLSGLEVVRTVSADTLAQGEEVEIAVTVQNRRAWPIPWIFLDDQFPRDFPIAGLPNRLSVLMPGQRVEIRYALTCPRRGYHRIGPMVLESGDLFGLQRRFVTSGERHYIAVLPTVAYIESFTVAARRPQGPVRISNRIYEDPTRIAGLREYTPGDPLSRIHWKASARTGELFVKQNEPSNVLGATLILDLHEDSYLPEGRAERMELAITTTASIGYLLQMSGEQLGMLTNAADAAEVAQWEQQAGRAFSRADLARIIAVDPESDRLSPLEVPTRRGASQGMQIIENLARVLPGVGLDAVDLILSAYQRLPRDAALLPVVPMVAPALAEVLAQMRDSGFAVTVFLIQSRSAYEEAVGLLAPYRINVIHIEHERDLHELKPETIGR